MYSDAHVRALVLDTLELADRTPELHAGFRVLGRGGHAPGHHAERLRAENDGSHGPDALLGEPVEDPIGAHPDACDRDPCRTAEHVGAVLLRDGDVGGIDYGPADVGVGMTKFECPLRIPSPEKYVYDTLSRQSV